MLLRTFYFVDCTLSLSDLGLADLLLWTNVAYEPDIKHTFTERIRPNNFRKTQIPAYSIPQLLVCGTTSVLGFK